MTSFAVVKDSENDRLISWPREQNLHFADPPHVDLPDPSLFSRLRLASAKVSAIALDVANMFQNVALPAWLVSYFPLMPVTFGDLPGDLQRRIIDELGLKDRPTQRTRFRPHQKSLPMGFKWAVYIAHAFARRCIENAVQELAIVRGSPVRVVAFSRRSRLMRLMKVPAGAMLLMHIIDDINAVFLDWDPQDAIRFQCLVRRELILRHLPIKESKSTPTGQPITRLMPFIGRKWNLQTGAVRPKTDKLNPIRRKTLATLSKVSFISRKELERLIGTLLWISLGRRPIMANFRHVFLATHRSPNSYRSPSATLRRESYAPSSLSCPWPSWNSIGSNGKQS